MIMGGTGFLGYHAAKEFLKHGHRISVLALPPLPKRNLFPKQVDIHLSDMNQLSDKELLGLLKGKDAVVFAGGADDRTTPKAPAYPFFYQANVQSSIRFFTLARQAGVKRGVLLGSYFTYFNRIWPEKKLSQYHPYIRSRVEQAKKALEAAGDKLALTVLELPYIFGSMPGRKPLWHPLIKYIHSPLPLFYTKGGTNMVAVQHVAQAIVGAVERGEKSNCYVIGEENMTWKEMLHRLSQAAGRRKKVITMPTFLVRFLMRSIHLYHKIKNKEGGLHPVKFVNIQTIHTFFDPSHSQNALGYSKGKLNKAFQDTVRACIEP